MDLLDAPPCRLELVKDLFHPVEPRVSLREPSLVFLGHSGFRHDWPSLSARSPRTRRASPAPEGTSHNKAERSDACPSLSAAYSLERSETSRRPRQSTPGKR